ncbi:MAG TPA: fumarylacetoacetate hydrolase family protein [Parasegetibacter sp.]
MKLLTYQSSDGPKLGILINDKVVDAVALGDKIGMQIPSTMLEMIDAGLEFVAQLETAIANTPAEILSPVAVPFDTVDLLAPIPKPRKNIFGIGLNYTDHVSESARILDTPPDLPKEPVIFSKPPTAVIGTKQAIKHNKNLTQQLDWEVELGVVIGKGGKFIPKEKALDHVFGYTVINDISARDCRRAGQWIVSKGQDTFAPMGPILVTRDEISDPHNLNLSLKVNGIEKQNCNTSFMLFNVFDLIQDLSKVFTLEPGDIIATGTPSGVGAGRVPQEWLWPGDVVEATVEGIGTIINHVEDATR